MPSQREKPDPTAGHSPLPWFVDPMEPVDIIDERQRPIAIDLMPADAAFIVRAVNHHDALVGALRAVIADLEHRESDGWMSGNVHGDAYDKARAVLRAVSEE